jgi:hypothetical protein
LVHGGAGTNCKPADRRARIVDTDSIVDYLHVWRFQRAIGGRTVGRIALFEEAEVTCFHAMNHLLNTQHTRQALGVRNTGLAQASRMLVEVRTGFVQAVANLGRTCITGARPVIVACALDTGTRFRTGIGFNEGCIANTLAADVGAIAIGRARAALASQTQGSAW